VLGFDGGVSVLKLVFPPPSGAGVDGVFPNEGDGVLEPGLDENGEGVLGREFAPIGCMLFAEKPAVPGPLVKLPFGPAVRPPGDTLPGEKALGWEPGVPAFALLFVVGQFGAGALPTPVEPNGP
jgi:hypothetical protein